MISCHNLLVMGTHEPSLQVNSSFEQPVNLSTVVYEEAREQDFESLYNVHLCGPSNKELNFASEVARKSLCF